MKAVRLSVLIVAAVLLWNCNSSPKVTEAAKPAPPPPIASPGTVVLPADSPKLSQIKVVAVEPAAIPANEVLSPAKVEANPNRTSHVSLPVAGRVVAVAVKTGDLVSQGQPLLELESPDVDASLSAHLQALGGLTQAKSAAVKARADLDRVRDLLAHEAVAQKEVLNAEAMLTQNSAAVEQAEATVQQAKRRLEILGLQPGKFGQTVTVKAPIAGKILEMSIVQGEYRNDVSQAVMTIADLSMVWVTADVQESMIRLIQLGQPANIDLAAFPNETFTGKVKQIADIVDPQTRTVKVRVELDNRVGRFRPEMFGRIRNASGLETRPVIPATAIIEAEDQEIVWKELSPGNFRKTKVTLGGRIGNRVAVLQGLAPGDRVVANGVMLLQSN